MDDDLYKLNPASPAAEARRIVESLVKWNLNECNNEKVYKFVKPFLTTWKSPAIIESIRKNSCNREKLWRNYLLLCPSSLFDDTS